MKKTVISALISLTLLGQTALAQTINSINFYDKAGGFEIVGNAMDGRISVELLEKIYDGSEEERLEYIGMGEVQDGEYSHSVLVYNPSGLYKLKVKDGTSKDVTERYLYMSNKLAADGVNTDMPSAVTIGESYTIETDVKNYTKNAIDLYYYAGFYDKAGTLIGVEINDVTAQVGARSIGFSVEVPPIPDIAGIKIMLMDEYMHPLGASISATVKEHNAVYVSKDGENGEFTNISEALTYADSLPGESVVYLREGVYGEHLDIKNISDVTIAAYPGDEVLFTNAIELSPSDFTSVKDSEIYERFPANARDKVREFDLTSAGISGAGVIPKISYNAGEAPYDVLTINSKRCEIARWPNEGYTQLFNKISCDDETMAFRYIYSRGENWLTADKFWVNGFWNNGWSTYSMPATIDKINQPTSKTDHYYKITTDGSAGSLLGGLPAGRFYVYNLPEEMDLPGEWFIDTDTNKLYVYADENFDNSEIRFAYEEKNAINITSSDNIGICGITFDGIKGSAIYATDADGLMVYDCNFKNITNDCIVTTGYDMLIASNTISSVGCCGINITGGYVPGLTPSNNVIINNEIYDYAKDYRVYNPAIRVDGVAMKVSHNKIYNAPHTAIQFSGNENIIEYNDIRNVLRETGDAGAIYAGRNLLGNGNVVRYNYFEDFERVSFVDEFGTPISYSAVSEVVAIYLDDLFSGANIYGNIMNNVDVGVLMGGGSNNVIKNNIIMNKTNPKSYAISADARGTDGRDISAIVANAKKISYTTGLWAYRYPENITSMSDKNIGVPINNIIENNVLYNHNSLDINELVNTNGTVKTNAVFATDPGFVDYKNNNFALRPDAGVFDIIPEFENIPFGRIGLNR